MKYLGFGLVAASFWFSQAHADTVEVTFNVVGASQYIGAWVNGSEQRINTSDEPLAPFSVVYRFDTENPILDTPGQGSTVYVSSLFRNGSSTDTPYTAWLNNVLPPASLAVWPLETQTNYGHSITDYDGPTVPQPSYEGAGFSTGARWEFQNSAAQETYAYSRGIAWNQAGPMIARQDFHALNAAEFTAWLQGQTGKTLTGAFNEVAQFSAVRLVNFGGQMLPSGNPEDLLDWKSIGVRGDVVIQSVVTIPEPATSALWALGAVGLAAAARRRQRQA